MCGIFGTNKPLEETEVEQLLALINHRGPDSSGALAIDDLHLLHTRLAIQDLSALGHQPMVSRDGNWYLTYNGEIYNHLSLRESVKKSANIDFKSHSDTETLVEYLAHFGFEKTLPVINGMYAFAAYHKPSRKLYLARDPYGIKPLYYRSIGDSFSFSSEIKPLLAHGEPAELDQEALSTFLSFRYVPSPDTLLKGIHRLGPGHCLEFDLSTGRHQVRNFWPTTTKKFQGSFEEAVTGYHDVLNGAVKRQLISDVPVGVLLSAGIDSAVVASLAKNHTAALSSHTVGFGAEHTECEIDGARETASTLGIEHNHVTVDPTTLIEDLPEIVAQVEEPLGTTSIMPMWHLSKLARENSIVVLTGQGNDEPWGGYRRYQLELLLQRAPFLKSKPFQLARHLIPLTKDEGLRRGLASLGISDTQSRFEQAYALFSHQELAAMGIKPGAATALSRWMNTVQRAIDVEDGELMMRIDTRMNLSDDLLLYGDKVSMKYALEARVPMLDNDVVEFVESLPLSYRTGIGKTKIVHRKMAERYLPDSIINRPKQGFQVPFGPWSKTIWRDFVEDHLFASNAKIKGVLDEAGMRKIWKDHLNNKMDYSRQIFALLCLSLWLDVYR